MKYRRNHGVAEGCTTASYVMQAKPNDHDDGDDCDDDNDDDGGDDDDEGSIGKSRQL